jgi:transcriptional regulator with XRE-family HTH domain
MNISEILPSKRKIRLLKDKELRNKYVIDQIKIGLRNQLRTLRDDRGLKQKELAELIGTKQSVISRMERSPVNVGMTTFFDIARALDVAFVVRFEAIDTFINWYDNPTEKKMTPPKSEDVLSGLEELTATKASATPQVEFLQVKTSAKRPIRVDENVMFLDDNALSALVNATKNSMRTGVNSKTFSVIRGASQRSTQPPLFRPTLVQNSSGHQELKARQSLASMSETQNVWHSDVQSNLRRANG